ncbi:glycerophosphodiester phosphodiesterase [Candidatus Nitrospira allomarina]|jgi:glycerophosphoryl diester phosphodiesterase|uniref:Glycerophosphodiester phosphodiesterase family protein n=1 Tax=Candidatus Nitrospira allomarina TaxID=3020900 RepID=A0AA96GAA4_9BACT|nr:glycerophosphodiester phosphodiesterase family protein [Candidatus Nitrospira allomarina]WNM57831.1 glycerophosphodiester phosphodiesterase family protein [Candidatus Nitrospira allomarina]
MTQERDHIRMPLRIGHRGASGHAPENTLAALELAIKYGVDMVEFDIRRSGDGALVLLHDDSVDRTTNGEGKIEELSRSVLRELDVGGDERVPLLEEALVCLSGRAGAMIELKVKGIAADVCAKVEATDFHGTVIYASFFHEELLTVRRLMGDALTLALIEDAPIHSTAFAIEAQATHAGLALNVVTPALVQALQAKDIKVFVYTIDEPEEIARMKGLGVDGIISNFPDRI